jgi:ABC-type amino acid transport substrate-binding protein
MQHPPPPNTITDAMSAAFQELLAEGLFATLYEKHIGLAPRIVPPSASCPWPPRVDGATLDRALLRGVLRLGFCINPPYHFRDEGGAVRGLDHELGHAIGRRIGRHYGVDLAVEWIETSPSTTPEPQLAMSEALYDGLRMYRYDAVMSGLVAIPDMPVARAMPTTMLYTGVFYTGRDDLDLRGLRGGERASLLAALASHPDELTFLSTVNPGPSARSTEALVADLVSAGGRATAPQGSVAELIEAMESGSSHFVVGDSVSLGYFANRPGFRGTNLDLPAADGALALSPFALPGGHLTSDLAEVLSAAFREFCARPGAYPDLLERYLGVRRDPPDEGPRGRFIPAAEARAGTALRAVLERGVLRFGFWRHAPYYFTREGRDVGFELELGEAMGEILTREYRGLRIEWVELDFTPDGQGQENLLLFDEILPALLQGRVDALFTGLIRRPDRPVGVAAATMQFGWTAVYTGKDGWDMSAVRDRSRDHFVRFMIEHPGALVLSTPGGPSEQISAELAADVVAAGGRARSETATIPGLIEATRTRSHHFIVGDAVALADLAMKPALGLLNLNLSVRKGDVEWLAPMTALDPLPSNAS